MLKSLFAVMIPLACAVAAQHPQLIEMNVGDSVKVPLASGKSRTLKLVAYTEQKEPYYEPANNGFADAVVSAEVVVEVDGKRATVVGGPFHMPAAVNGINLLVGTTRGWTGGIVPDHMSKDVRLEAQDASQPWSEPGRFVFPVRHYRWRVMNYQHTWLGLAVNQARLYYHRGEDMGMIPDLEESLAMTDAVVRKVPGPQGDGASNTVILEDGSGLVFHYAHMNAPNILPELQPGVQVKQGQKLGLTGNTWRGAPVKDPHLHVEVHAKQSNGFRNTFPLFVAAYRNSFPGELLPIAGGWRHLFADGSIALDGSRSLAGDGRKIVSYEWTFTDGTHAKGATVRRTYTQPGTYSEQLRVTDDRGRSDLDFVEVFVLSKQQHAAPPYALIDYYPIRGIRPGTEIAFLTRYNNMRDVTIDFGDGTVVPYAENTTHKFGRSGTYVVTVKGTDAGSGPGTLKVRVIVEQQRLPGMASVGG